MKINLDYRGIAVAGVAATMLLAASLGHAQDQSSSAQDRQFVESVARSGLLEVEIGELAIEQARDPGVIALAEVLVRDHGNIYDALASTAAKLDLPIPETLSDEDDYHAGQLESLSGDRFDTQYIDLVVNEHQVLVDLFREQAEEGKAGDLVRFAANHQALMQDHLRSAEASQRALMMADQ